MSSTPLTWRGTGGGGGGGGGLRSREGEQQVCCVAGAHRRAQAGKPDKLSSRPLSTPHTRTCVKLAAPEGTSLASQALRPSSKGAAHLPEQHSGVDGCTKGHRLCWIDRHEGLDACRGRAGGRKAARGGGEEG